MQPSCYDNVARLRDYCASGDISYTLLPSWTIVLLPEPLRVRDVNLPEIGNVHYEISHSMRDFVMNIALKYSYYSFLVPKRPRIL